MKAKSQTTIALDRILTLSALAAASSAYYGLRILLLCAAAMITAMLTEFICLYVRKIPFQFQHLEAAAVGLLLTMLLPPTISYSVLIIACIFAIIIGRQIFGGSENPVFPAAAVGYAFVQFTWKADALQMPTEPFLLPLRNIIETPLTDSASALWNTGSKISGDWLDWLLCVPRLPIGSASLLILATVMLVMFIRRSASASVTLGMLFTILIFGIVSSAPAQFLGAGAFTLLTNSALLSAVFLFGDPRLAPKGILGVCFGVISGFLCFYLTRIMHIENAPVLLSIIMQPVAYAICDIKPMLSEQQEKEAIS